MRTILLVRHAKSSWENFSVADIDRPLNDRGKKNATEMAERLLKKNISIGAFLSSPAKRALSTAKLFAKAYGRSPREIIVIPGLYEPGQAAFTKAVVNAPDASSSIAIFSHNPGITAFANALTPASSPFSETPDALPAGVHSVPENPAQNENPERTVRIDDMPTCSVFAVRFAIDSWAAFAPGTGEFYFFDYPRNR